MDAEEEQERKKAIVGWRRRNRKGKERPVEGPEAESQMYDCRDRSWNRERELETPGGITQQLRRDVVIRPVVEFPSKGGQLNKYLIGDAGTP